MDEEGIFKESYSTPNFLATETVGGEIQNQLFDNLADRGFEVGLDQEPKTVNITKQESSSSETSAFTFEQLKINTQWAHKISI